MRKSTKSENRRGKVSEYKLSEEDCIKILETEPVEVKETNAVNFIKLSKEEQIKRATEILNRRR